MNDNNIAVKQPTISNQERRVIGRPFPKGVSGNPHGRPKKGMTLTDIAKEILEEQLPDGKTRKELLMRKVAQLAYDGNETMIKMIWNYVDGMPTQRTELTGKDSEPITGIIYTAPEKKQ